MKTFFLHALFFYSFIAFSQVNWTDDVAPILYNKCLSCHHSEGIGSDYVVLEKYHPAYKNRNLIDDVVSDGHMPIWPPDTNYTTLAGQNVRTLTANELQTIQDWVSSGALPGDTTLKPPLPVFSSFGDIPDVADAILPLPLYTIDTTGTNGNDVYRCFVIPSHLVSDRYISAIDFVPGNRKAVHHMVIFYDTTGQAQVLDQNDSVPGYSSYGGAGFAPVDFLGGWVPGIQSEYFPNGMGILAPKNGDYVLQVHYPKTAHGEQDSSILKIYYTPTNTNVRRIFLAVPLIHSFTMTNGPLVIPADSIKTFYEEFALPPVTTSFLAVVPHMHNIGRKIKTYAFSPQNDTVKFVSIEDWDFDHQMFYKFQKLLKIEPGSTLRAEALFDNTANNPKAPLPLRTIYEGESSEDEMMLVGFAFLAYQPGDENIVLDSSIFLSTENRPPQQKMTVSIYPNPTNGRINIHIPWFSHSSLVELVLTNSSGAVVYRSAVYAPISTFNCAFLPAGVYVYTILENGVSKSSGKLKVLKN